MSPEDDITPGRISGPFIPGARGIRRIHLHPDRRSNAEREQQEPSAQRDRQTSGEAAGEGEDPRGGSGTESEGTSAADEARAEGASDGESRGEGSSDREEGPSVDYFA